MLFGLSIRGSALSSVRLSVVFNLLVPIVSGSLSTNTNSYVLNTGDVRKFLSLSNLYAFLCRKYSTFNFFANEGQSRKEAATEYGA